jgi:hypothetical protein
LNSPSGQLCLEAKMLESAVKHGSVVSDGLFHTFHRFAVVSFLIRTCHHTSPVASSDVVITLRTSRPEALIFPPFHSLSPSSWWCCQMNTVRTTVPVNSNSTRLSFFLLQTADSDILFLILNLIRFITIVFAPLPSSWLKFRFRILIQLPSTVTAVLGTQWKRGKLVVILATDVDVCTIVLCGGGIFTVEERYPPTHVCSIHSFSLPSLPLLLPHEHPSVPSILFLPSLSAPFTSHPG